MFNVIAPISFGPRCFSIKYLVRNEQGQVVGEAIYSRRRRGHRVCNPVNSVQNSGGPRGA